MQTVIIARNSLDPSTWVRHETNSVLDLLLSEFDAWPEGARIFHGQVSEDNDVTPKDEAGIERLKTLEGVFYVVVFPAGPVAIVLAIITIIVAAVAINAIPKAQAPTVSTRNTQAQSSNNALSDRQNQARPLARIPDIFGKVRSTPDLIAPTYSVYDDHVQIEHSTMCVGRGEFVISSVKDDKTLVSEIPGSTVEVYKPGETPYTGIKQLLIGSAITEDWLNVSKSNAVNGQELFPDNNNETLSNPANTGSPSYNIKFFSDGRVQLDGGSLTSNQDMPRDFITQYHAGDRIRITDAYAYSGGPAGQFQDQTWRYKYVDNEPVNGGDWVYFQMSLVDASNQVNSSDLFDNGKRLYFHGAGSAIVGYANVSNLSLSRLVAFDAGENSYFLAVRIENHKQYITTQAWATTGWATATVGVEPNANITKSYGGLFTVRNVNSSTEMQIELSEATAAGWDNSPNTSAWIQGTGARWVGPFTIGDETSSRVISNLLAPQGIYKDDGSNQFYHEIEVAVEITPVDSAGVQRPGTSVVTTNTTIQGSAATTGNRARTLEIPMGVIGPYKIRAKRVTAYDTAFNGRVIDETRWDRVYSASAMIGDFSGLTIIRARTEATSGATEIKQRKLNMLASRKIPKYDRPNSVFLAEQETSTAADVLFAMAKDTRIGGLVDSQIDYNQIYDEYAKALAALGHAKAVEFNYTFDKHGMSFEETVRTISAAMHAQAFRRGAKLQTKYEGLQSVSALLFNHRNKIPGSETRTVRFGRQNNYDGIELRYADEADYAIATYYIPTNRTAVNPKKIETVGVVSKFQAHFLAWREYNKLRFRNKNVQFDATQEAAILFNGDRILVADETRDKVQDGEIESQDGLRLWLTQTVALAVGNNYIHIQHTNGTTETIAITAGTTDRDVVLATAPSQALSLDDSNFAKATYLITTDQGAAKEAFVVQEKSPSGETEFQVKAYNYDTRYYQNDADYTTGKLQLSGLYDPTAASGGSGATSHLFLMNETGAANSIINSVNGNYFTGGNGRVNSVTSPPPKFGSTSLWIRDDLAQGKAKLKGPRQAFRPDQDHQIEAWIRWEFANQLNFGAPFAQLVPTSGPVNAEYMFGLSSSDGNWPFVGAQVSKFFVKYYTSAGVQTHEFTTAAPSIATWHKVELAKAGTTFYLLIDGAVVETFVESNAIIIPNGEDLFIAHDSIGNRSASAYFERIKITANGYTHIANYTLEIE